MQTAIQSSDFTLTRALTLFIKDQIEKSMHVSDAHIQKLTVRLKDLNGPKGGNDKECCIEITIPDQAPVIVKKRSSDAYASIRNAIGRASRITLRRLRKKRDDKRQLSPTRIINAQSSKDTEHHHIDNKTIALSEYPIK